MKSKSPTITHFLAKQLKLPNGLFGWLYMPRFLNRKSAVMVEKTVELLKLKPDDEVLDVGFGGAHAIYLMLRKVTSGRVVGIDFSRAMVSRARREFRRSIKQNRLSIINASVAKMPFSPDSFDKICTINTVYFWSDIECALQEVYRVLRSKGKLVITVRSEARMQQLDMARYGFNIYSADELITLLKQARFSDVELTASNDNKYHFFIAKK